MSVCVCMCAYVCAREYMHVRTCNNVFGVCVCVCVYVCVGVSFWVFACFFVFDF